MKNIILDVPEILQENWCSCGIAAINMVLHFYGLKIPEIEFEKNPLITRDMLKYFGVGPGRLGRLALRHNFKTTIYDTDRRDVGKMFLKEGGIWIRKKPDKNLLEECLSRGIPPVVCIPDKSKAFPNTTHRGSHWVTIVGMKDSEFIINDPAPWRRAKSCVKGYWNTWNCCAIIIEQTKET